jgi:hypothetical protein
MPTFSSKNSEFSSNGWGVETTLETTDSKVDNKRTAQAGLKFRYIISSTFVPHKSHVVYRSDFSSCTISLLIVTMTTQRLAQLFATLADYIEPCATDKTLSYKS